MKKAKKNKSKNKKPSVQSTGETFTQAETDFLKQLYAEAKIKQEVAATSPDKSVLVVPDYTGKTKRTSIGVYTEQWDRWNAFKEKHKAHSGTDLLALALDEFMEKYDA